MRRPLTSTEVMSISMMILGIGVLADIITGRFSPPALIFSVALLLLGKHYWTKRRSMRANILILAGVLMLAGQVFSSIAFQLMLAAGLLYTGYQLLISRQAPLRVQPGAQEAERSRLTRKKAFLRNFMVGTHRVINEIYELQDINIRYGIGDVEVDLSTAMIPEGETVLMIHGVAGNIRLYVPYDVELSLNHCALLGEVSVLGEREKGWNTNVVLSTEGYSGAARRIKIVTSLLVGDTEVRYV